MTASSQKSTTGSVKETIRHPTYKEELTGSTLMLTLYITRHLVACLLQKFKTFQLFEINSKILDKLIRNEKCNCQNNNWHFEVPKSAIESTVYPSTI